MCEPPTTVVTSISEVELEEISMEASEALIRGTFSMKAAPFDIFRKGFLGTPVWMEAVQDLKTAKLRIMELARRSPADTSFSARKANKS
jgi:hypothetical protein